MSILASMLLLVCSAIFIFILKSPFSSEGAAMTEEGNSDNPSKVVTTDIEEKSDAYFISFEEDSSNIDNRISGEIDEIIKSYLRQEKCEFSNIKGLSNDSSQLGLACNRVKAIENYIRQQSDMMQLQPTITTGCLVGDTINETKSDSEVEFVIKQECE